MSDYLGLGALLGMSPPFVPGQQWAAAMANARANAYAQSSLVGWLNSRPPPPEPGITWQPTGGKTWRVTITR